jgi:hypothetical protein
MAETTPTHSSGLEGEPYLLTVEQTAELLSIGRTLAHKKTKLFLDSGGVAVDGIPAVRIGRAKRVPRVRLLEWIDRGCMNAPSAPARDELAPRRRTDDDRPPRPQGARPDEPPPEQPPLFPAV